MAKVIPFICIRPDEGVADKVAALPYDVYSRSEAKAFVADKPLSFLNIDRPETQYGEDFDMYSPKAYETARDMLRARIKDGTFVIDRNKSYYVYELTMDGRTQTGIVACCSIDDYAEGVIKKHENTLAAKEEDRVNHIRTTGFQTGPIFLAYRKDPVIAAAIAEAKAQKPLYDFVSDDGIGHRAWIVGAHLTDAVRAAFDKINAIYIADGHHRAASAVRVGMEKRAQMNEMPCCAERDPESDYFLSVLFADEELKILPYNRVVRGTPDMRTLSSIFDIEEEDGPAPACSITDGKGSEDVRGQAPLCREQQGSSGKDTQAPLTKGQINMYTDHKWYRLTLKDEYKSDDPVDGLDVSRLQDLVLEPMFGIHDPKTDKNIAFVGGIRGDKELERLVDSGDYGVAFSMYPTQMSELLAVADAGRLMPPKSTWFEPKLRSGLFIHKI